MASKQSLQKREAMKAEHIQIVQKINVVSKSESPKGLAVIQDFDLRGLDPKINHAATLPNFIFWVAFVNKKGNLAHILHREDLYSYVRMKLPVALKGCSNNFVSRYFYLRMVNRYRI
jgi:hypothetical protein